VSLPGGKGQLFLAAQRVKFTSSKFQKIGFQEEFGLTKEQALQVADRCDIGFDLYKNKSWTPRGSAKFGLWLRGPKRGQIDELGQIVRACGALGYVESLDSGYRLLGQEFKKKKDIVDFIQQNDSARAILVERISRKMMETIQSDLDLGDD
jgi:hypothetical protein